MLHPASVVVVVVVVVVVFVEILDDYRITFTTLTDRVLVFAGFSGFHCVN